MLAGSIDLPPHQVGCLVPRLLSASDVVIKASEIGTSCRNGNPMDFLKARRADSVYVASNGKARISQTAVMPLDS